MTSLTEVQRRAEATRQRIADVAERLFRDIGYQKTAVADIARELGMSPANVYRFYASKSAINEAICARILGGIAEGVWAIARGGEPASARLSRVAHYMFERNIASFFKEKRMHDMVSAALAEHWGVIERFIADEHGATRHIIAEGIAAGEFHRDDPDRLAHSFNAALVLWKHPMVIEECSHRGEGEKDLGARLDDMLDLLLRGLRA